MKLADLKLGTDRNSLVAQVTGDIDMSNADDLGAALTDAISNDLLGAVLDLSALDYLDSAGVQLIYTLRERLRARGQELSLVIADGSQVAAALRLAGATSYVKAVPSVEQALENLFGHEPAEA
jgi:anti-sigma B factor antagonist